MTIHDLQPTGRGWQKALAVGLTALALLVFAIVYVRQVEKNPLRMDEVDMYSSIANWVTLGAPILYLGQPLPPDDWLLPLGERTLGDGQLYSFYRIKPETGVSKEFFIAAREGLVGRYTYFPHPQLYLAGHALLYRLFPLTPDTSHLMRYFNLLWVAGLIAGMALLSRELYRRQPLVFRQRAAAAGAQQLRRARGHADRLPGPDRLSGRLVRLGLRAQPGAQQAELAPGADDAALLVQ